MPSTPAKDTQRIAKLLARAGIASRREIERMIGEGRVAIDGKTVETPATLLTSLHGVTVDGNPVKAAAPARLFRFHKPVGLLTTERDPKGRPTIYDRLPKDLPRLMPIGRLDMNTEGLLLLTTDGELKRQLELPATGVERTYRARAFGDISQEQLETLIEGIEIEGIRYGPIDANLERRTGRNQWIELRLREGKNREVRRVLEHLGLQISRLIRTAYGPFHLEDLPAGGVDEVRQHDLVAFRKDVTAPGVRPSAARRPSGPGAEPRREFERGQPQGRPNGPARPRTTAPRPASDGRRPSARTQSERRGPEVRAIGHARSAKATHRATADGGKSLERPERPAARRDSAGPQRFKTAAPKPFERLERSAREPVRDRDGHPRTASPRKPEGRLQTKRDAHGPRGDRDSGPRPPRKGGQPKRPKRGRY